MRLVTLGSTSFDADSVKHIKFFTDEYGREFASVVQDTGFILVHGRELTALCDWIAFNSAYFDDCKTPDGYTGWKPDVLGTTIPNVAPELVEARAVAMLAQHAAELDRTWRQAKRAGRPDAADEDFDAFLSTQFQMRQTSGRNRTRR